MTRTYDRDAQHFDRTVLTHLVETGQAQYYPAQGGIYVVKTESGTFAVRQHQIIDSPLVTAPVVAAIDDVVEVRVSSPMDGYSGKENYDGEDTGPGGVVYDSMLALAQEYVAVLGSDTDPLVIVRRMLDDEAGEVEHAIREQVADARPARRGYLTVERENDLLARFL